MAFLYARQNPLDDAKNTLSSWDNCMAKNYCNGSGGRSGHQRVKSEPTPIYPTPYSAPVANPYAAHSAAPPAPPIDSRPVNQQYRSNAMPTFNPAPVPDRPQYATFSSPTKPANEDALPAMPTWKDGRDVHVEAEEEAVPQKRGDMEMDRLNHNGSVTNTSMTGMAAVGAAGRSPGAGRSLGPGRTPIQRSPTGDSYGFPPGYQNDSFVGASPQRNSPSPYGKPYAQQDDYRRVSPGPNNLSPMYGPGEGYAQNQLYSRHSPQPQLYDQHNDQDRYDPPNQYSEPDRRYHSPSPPAINTNLYNNNNNNYASHDAAPYDNFAPAQQQQQRSNTPGYAPSGSTRYEPSTTAAPSAYPGQQSYSPQGAYPGQQTYQAFQPGEQYSGVTRKAVDGSYKDI
ncbi:hypothetical protein N0V83_005957 [Neocucurbitaria cava]|uniref:Uncharacterized protein n=1 Tax=Neocucurbitaria cava TaxID=798079 RepID=A0A9W8Y934_9PLEO|nr:hypothetical protein N0V83_005957 [Neocucurbitaria cava]